MTPTRHLGASYRTTVRTSALGPGDGTGGESFRRMPGPRAAEDLERFKTALRLKFETEADRYTTLPKGRMTYVFARLEGRASALCVNGVARGSAWR